MMGLLKKFVRLFAWRTSRAQGLYRRICQPGSLEWGGFLARWRNFYCVGKDVSINIGCNVTDPAYMRIDNNVALSACTLLGHDAFVRILNNRYGKKMDSVGYIDIRDE